MQAITTLHAQLCLATEKLDLAQKSLITQKKAIHDLEEEGRMMWEEIDDLKEMLDNVENDEKSELEKLGELRQQARVSLEPPMRVYPSRLCIVLAHALGRHWPPIDESAATPSSTPRAARMPARVPRCCRPQEQVCK